MNPRSWITKNRQEILIEKDKSYLLSDYHVLSTSYALPHLVMYLTTANISDFLPGFFFFNIR